MLPIDEAEARLKRKDEPVVVIAPVLLTLNLLTPPTDQSARFLAPEPVAVSVTLVWKIVYPAVPDSLNVGVEVITFVTAEEAASNVQPPDLGRMGWRLGKKLIRKVDNDKYGRRGTEARLLLRQATSLDVLHDRPSGSKMPPGFTAKRVLGPHSDLQHTKVDEKKKKRSRGPVSNEDGTDRCESKRALKKNIPTTLEGLLNGSLISGRPGFSVEDMKAERSKKKMRPSPS